MCGVALAQMAGQLQAANAVVDKLNVTINELNSEVRIPRRNGQNRAHHHHR